MNTFTKELPNYGYIRSIIPKGLLLELRNVECEVGHKTGLSKKYEKTPKHYIVPKEKTVNLFPFIHNIIELYEKKFHYINTIGILNNPRPFSFQEPWVNIQKGDEYLAPHTHDGIFAYSIWLKLPTHSMFEFLYPTTIGTRAKETFNLTPKDEGGILLFPSLLEHSVHPFSGEGTRMSLSGNILFSV